MVFTLIVGSSIEMTAFFPVAVSSRAVFHSGAGAAVGAIPMGIMPIPDTTILALIIFRFSRLRGRAFRDRRERANRATGELLHHLGEGLPTP